MKPYRSRTIRFHPLLEVDGWRLKTYSISVDGSPVAWDAFAAGLEMACEALPRPARAHGRSGVGFVIGRHLPPGTFRHRCAPRPAKLAGI